MQVNRASWAHSSLKYFLTLTNTASSSLRCVLCRFLLSYFANIPWANFLKSWQCIPGWASFSFLALLLFLDHAHLITVCWNLHVSISIKSLPYSSPVSSTCCFLPGKWKRPFIAADAFWIAPAVDISLSLGYLCLSAANIWKVKVTLVLSSACKEIHWGNQLLVPLSPSFLKLKPLCSYGSSDLFKVVEKFWAAATFTKVTNPKSYMDMRLFNRLVGSVARISACRTESEAVPPLKVMYLISQNQLFQKALQRCNWFWG